MIVVFAAQAVVCWCRVNVKGWIPPTDRPTNQPKLIEVARNAGQHARRVTTLQYVVGVENNYHVYSTPVLYCVQRKLWE